MEEGTLFNGWGNPVNATIISSGDTEIGSIRDKFEALKDFEFIGLNEIPENYGKKILVDFTFDIFNKDLRPEFLFRVFSDLQKHFDALRFTGTPFNFIINYPFGTNQKNYLYFQRIIDRYLELLGEFYNVKQVLIPNIISRFCFTKIQSPVIHIINSARMGKSLKVNLTENSRVTLIYGIDLVTSLLTALDHIGNHNVIIEGIDLCLKDIDEIARRIAGEAPIQFDKERFIKYNYPGTQGSTVNNINYEFENMMIDLVNNLF